MTFELLWWPFHENAILKIWLAKIPFQDFFHSCYKHPLKIFFFCSQSREKSRWGVSEILFINRVSVKQFSNFLFRKMLRIICHWELMSTREIMLDLRLFMKPWRKVTKKWSNYCWNKAQTLTNNLLMALGKLTLE
jgi:hypothetical protein